MHCIALPFIALLHSYSVLKVNTENKHQKQVTFTVPQVSRLQELVKQGEQGLGSAEGHISNLKDAQKKLLEELDATRARLRETSNLLTALQVYYQKLLLLKKIKKCKKMRMRLHTSKSRNSASAARFAGFFFCIKDDVSNFLLLLLSVSMNSF